MANELPPLPDTALAEVRNPYTLEKELSETGTAYYGSNWYEVRRLFTADQMHAYARDFARAAVLAEREACAKVCEDRDSGQDSRMDQEDKACAAAIRARSTP